MQIVDQVTAAELAELFDQADWAKGRTRSDLTALLENGTSIYVAARDDKGHLIGFARALSDGRYRALLDDVVVDHTHRGQGIGQALVQALLDQLTHVDQIALITGGTAPDFYAKFGFQPTSKDTVVMRRDR